MSQLRVPSGKSALRPVPLDETVVPLEAAEDWAAAVVVVVVDHPVAAAQVDDGTWKNSAAFEFVDAAVVVVVDGAVDELAVVVDDEVEVEAQTPGSTPSINFSSFSWRPLQTSAAEISSPSKMYL